MKKVKVKILQDKELMELIKKKETLNCNNCPHKPKQISASQEVKTGKLSRIL